MPLPIGIGARGAFLPFALLLLTLCLPPALSAAPALAQSRIPLDAADLETFLDGMLAAHLESHHIPGATLAVVHDGELLLAKGYGFADLAAQTPVDPETTLFRPGSTAKLVTWTAVMQLAEQGRIDLDADVNRYLDFSLPATFPEPITVAHLLAHTPGFEDVGEGLFVLSPEELLSLEEYLKRYQPRRVYPPGRVSAYSNYGTALAGYIVERVSGRPFAAYVEEHIFAPLGMARSTFRQPLPPDLAAALATGYNYDSGLYRAGGFEFISAAPAGALSAPAADMARFMIAHLQEGRLGEARILQEATARQMHSQLFTPDARLGGMAHGFMTTTVNDRRVLHHGGDTPLFHTALYLVPEENLGLFVSYNALGGALVREALFHALMDRYFPATRPAAPPPAGAAERAAAIAGEYHLARANHSTLEKPLRLADAIRVRATPEGVLFVTFGGISQPFVEIEPGLYQHQQRQDRALFQVGADGRAWLHLGAAAPFSAYRPAWYETSSFVLLLLGGGLALFLFSMGGWLNAHLATRGRAAPPPRLARAARWLAALFGLLLLLFLNGVLGLLTDIHPDYGVPRIFFGDPPGLSLLLGLPWLLALLALGMAAGAGLAWRRRFWGWPSRLQYSALAALALAIIWAFWHWNFLGG